MKGFLIPHLHVLGMNTELYGKERLCIGPPFGSASIEYTISEKTRSLKIHLLLRLQLFREYIYTDPLSWYISEAYYKFWKSKILNRVTRILKTHQRTWDISWRELGDNYSNYLHFSNYLHYSNYLHHSNYLIFSITKFRIPKTCLGERIQ